MRSLCSHALSRCLGVAACVLAGALSASAHHSVTGIFDVSKESTVTGKIADLEWINPHSYVHVEVTEPNGAVTRYALETLPPALMRRAGINREMLLNGKAVGQVVTVTFNPGRQDPHEGWLNRITYADGHFFQLSSPGSR